MSRASAAMGSAASEPRTALNSAALVCEAVEPLDVSEEEPPPLIVEGAVFEGNGLNEESVAFVPLRRMALRYRTQSVT